MRVLRNYIAFLTVVLAFSFVGVSAQTYTNVRSTQSIERQVFKKIIGLPFYGVFDHIAFKVDGGTVTLYGKVNSLGTRKSAERVVAKIPGVQNVVNNIENLPPSSFDNSIRRNLVRTFSRRGGSLYRYLIEPNPSMRLIVDRGHVTLEGYVSNRGDSNLANILANGIPGVFSVTNNLVVGRQDY